MQLIYFCGESILYFGAREERDTLKDNDLVQIAHLRPALEPLMRELQYRRNEMENEL